MDSELPEEFRLLGWVAEVGEGDAELMARDENERRRDLSYYEKCLNVARRAEAIGMNKGHRTLAQRLNLSAGEISEMLRDSQMDIGLLKLLESPNILTMRKCRHTHKSLIALEDDVRSQVTLALVETFPAHSFDSEAALIKAVKTCIAEVTGTKESEDEENKRLPPPEPSVYTASTVHAASGCVVAQLIPDPQVPTRCSLAMDGVPREIVEVILKLIQTRTQ